jgi:hypothetical protein
MRHKIPATENYRPALLASMYSFIREPTSLGTMSAASLKLECMIQTECTLPATLALEDVELRRLLKENVWLLKSEALTICLRNTAKSLNELVLEKYGQNAEFSLRETADFLDENCASVLQFDPNNASSAYKSHLMDCLSTFQQRAASKSERLLLDRLLNRLDKNDAPSFADAINLQTGIKRTDLKIEAAAKFWYCVSGSEAVNGTAHVPFDLWEQANQYVGIDHIDPTLATESSELSVAHFAVLEHFAINAIAFDRLSALDIVEMRTEGATKKMLAELQEIVEKAQREILEECGASAYTMEHIVDCRTRITEEVRKRCLAQAKRSGPAEYSMMGLEEGLSFGASTLDFVVPGIGFLRKGLLRVGRILSRKSAKLSTLDFTISPIQTYVSRIQARVSQNP